MKWILPLIALSSAMSFVVYGAVNMHRAMAVVTKNLPPPKAAEKPTPRGSPTEAGIRAAEPVHKSLVRCLNDLDDILDSIHDQSSFEAAKPKLLSRAREQAAQASLHPNAGMTQLGMSAQYELREATNRHAKSLSRATQAAPGLAKFFNDELGAILGR